MTDSEMLLNELIRLDYLHNPRYAKQDDIAISLFFSDVYKNEYRYCAEVKNWYHYNPASGVWKEDITHTVKKKAVALVVALREYGRRFLKEDTKDQIDAKIKFNRWVHNLGSHGARESFLKDSSVNGQFSKSQLDTDRNLLNCLDGVFDLETGEILDHSPDYLMSKCSCVKLKGKKTVKRWEQFIQEITENNVDLMLYLQKILGSCLIYGNSLEECYFIWGITTRNGKTTLLESVAHVFGDYAIASDPSTFATTGKQKDGSKPEPNVAELQGARFIRCPEPPRDMTLDVARIKEFTGGNEISTRTLNEKPFHFKSEAKIFFDVNHLPQINDLTVFSSKRLIVIPFDRHFEEDEQDLKLKNKLKSQDVTNAIFWWLWDGLRLWRTSDMTKRPDKVIEATKQYEEDSDKFGTFLRDYLQPTGNRKDLIAIQEAYPLFEVWADDTGVKAFSKRRFVQEAKARRIFKDRGTIDGEQKSHLLVGYKWNDEITKKLEKYL